jgi:hypothetical protein
MYGLSKGQKEGPGEHEQQRTGVNEVAEVTFRTHGNL